MQHKKTLLTLALLATLGTLSLLSGCKQNNQHDPNTLVRGNMAEPSTLDPAQVEDTASAGVLYDLFEGLTDFDQSDNVVPGMAKSWDVSPDGRVYTFHLRNDAKWSNGAPVTAGDFVYAWKRALDPKTASPYAFSLFPVLNAQAVNAGKMPASSLGVKVLNDKMLQVTLEKPNPFFLAMLTDRSTYPLYQPEVEKYGKAFMQPGNYVTNGAYMLKEWVPNGYVLLTKNPYYYDAQDVKIPNVKLLPITDASSELDQYKAGNLDVTYAVPVDQYKNLQQAYPDQLHTVQATGVYYYDFNLNKPPFKGNLKLRQALSMAVDRDTLTNEVLVQHNPPLYSLFPLSLENGVYDQFKPYSWEKLAYADRVKQAQTLLAQAGYSSTHPLVFSISYDTNDLNKKVAMAVVSMWQRAFGNAVQVQLINEEWSVLIQDRNNGNYQMASNEWLADYNNADNFTLLLQCNNPQNVSYYCNPGYDKLVEAASDTKTPAERLKLVEQSQSLALNDYPVVPVFQFTYARLVKPYVNGYDPTNNHLDQIHDKWFYFSN